MIWLPGAYQVAKDFLDAGFARAVQRRETPMDLGFVDLELQYLGDTSALRRLRDELVLPAPKMGGSLWLAGISLGGMIALDYAATYPEDLDGLCLLAPYLGNRMLIAEIAAAPELGAWQPGPLADDDTERRLWRYLQAGTGRARPRVHLGFGRDDRFAAAHRLLAQSLPVDSVDRIDGGHDWRTWTQLWENFLDSRHP
jgi:pimeloyl-ACP methyl ester carboxylesterase